ncbi:MAG: DUF2750 domain-containing protein [Hyphomicrobium sp.]
MLAGPRIQDIGQRDRFVRRAVKDGRIFTLADEERASVSSQRIKGRTVQLFWSSEKEARRWAEALSGEGALQELSLATFASDILPGLAAAKGYAGTDWVSDPVEPEIDPADLLLRLKSEAATDYVSRLIDGGHVYLVEGDKGPKLAAVTRRAVDMQLLPIFASRADAEQHVKPSGGTKVIADPIADFRASTLPWARERGIMIAFEPIPGGGSLELDAAAIEARFAKALAAHAA